jgi:hypothetical protein
MRTRGSARFAPYYKVQEYDPRSAVWMDVQKAHPTLEAARAACARHLARTSLGRIAIGAQDVEGNPSIESAVSAGWRTAREALAWL